MFAGCIEPKGSGYSQLLKEIHDSGDGLAGIKPRYAAYWQGSFESGEQCIVLEQPIVKPKSANQANSEPWSVFNEGGIVIAGWLRIDNRDELTNLLSLDSSGELSDRALIARAYNHWGKSFSEHLVGDFSFALFDLNASVAMLVRDHFGVRPLFYCQVNEALVFASSAKVIQQLCGSLLTVNDMWVTEYLLGVSVSWTDTCYNEVFKLAPAHQLEFANKSASIDAYFSLDSVVPLKPNSGVDFVSEYKALLVEAVKCRVDGLTGAVASESTGGLDSSTVTALASGFMEQPSENLHTYAYIYLEQELECIEALTNHVPMVETCIVNRDKDNLDVALKEHAQPDLRLTAEKFIGYAGLPQEIGNATTHNPIYERASAEGANVLLSGFGGDEFTTTFGGLARVELFKTRQWRAWVACFNGNAITRPLRAIKWLLSFYRRRNTFQNSENIQRAVLERFDASPVKLSSEDYQRLRNKLLWSARYDAGHTSLNSFQLNNRWSPNMTSRMEQCSLAAAKYGLEYRWPLLDIRLVRYFLSVPVQEKYAAGVSRRLHRRAIKGILPLLIANKEKSMGNPLPKPKSENVDEDAFFKTLAQCDYEQLPKTLLDKLDPVIFEAYQSELLAAKTRADISHSVLYFSRIRWLNIWLDSLTTDS